MINLLLDSGAYSAWTQGKAVDLNSYCDYIERNQEWIGAYVALDVINPKDTHAAAEASFANLLTMRKRGLNPIPVFHVGENFDWLHRMLDLGCDYIGLSATSLTARSNIDPWYRSAWAHLVESDGLPIVKVHAFGETRFDALGLFPWQSADSTSWMFESMVTGRFRTPSSGKVSARNVVIDKREGFFADENHIIPTSRNAPAIDCLEGEDKIDFECEMAKHGIDPELTRQRDMTATCVRAYLTALHFKHHLETKTRLKHPITFREMQTEFQKGQGTPQASTADPVDVSPFNLYFVTNAAWWSMIIPTKAGITNMLASFYYIDKMPTHFKHLPAYVRDPLGFIPTHEAAAKVWNLLGEHIKS